MNNLAVFLALNKREMKIITLNITSRLIDGFFLVGSQVLGFGYLLPLAGMPAHLVAPIFLGTVTRIFFFLGFSFSMRRIMDLKYNRVIEYHLSFPFSKKWLIGQYIVAFMMEALVTSLPLIFFGILFLSPYFHFDQMNILAFIAVYLQTLLFYGIFFTYISFACSYQWFLDNVWARRFTPLILLGCTLFSWKATYAFSPFFGMLFLLNPLTYLNEALRAALLGQKDFLSLSLCMMVIALFSIAFTLLLARAVQKNLDPV